MSSNSRVRAAIAFCNALQDNTDTNDMLVFANCLLHGGAMHMTEQEAIEAINVVRGVIAQVQNAPFMERKDTLMEVLKKLDEDDEIYQAFLDTLGFKKDLASLLVYTNKFYEFGVSNEKKREHDYPGVVISTAHSSKGLEFPTVYNMISEYDSERMHATGKDIQKQVEEHRRLFFVSATRARDRLIVTSQYIVGGARDRGYCENTYLKEAYHIQGMNFDLDTILQQKELRAAEQKAQKAEAAAKRQQEIDEIKSKLAAATA